MRELILKMSMSIDGFVSGPNGEVAWMFGGDQAARAWSVEYLSGAGLHITGSRTFRDMASHWPTSTDVFAAPMNRIPKAVFSRRGAAILGDVRAHSGAELNAEPQPGAESWAEAYVASGDLTGDVAALKAQDGGPIIAHGGASFARSLVAAGLVDQFAFMVIPVALGQGKPIFSDLTAPMRLALVSSTAFPGGAVARVYRAGQETRTDFTGSERGGAVRIA